FALQTMVHAAALEHCSLEPLGFDIGHTRRPVATEAPAPYADPVAVDVRAAGQVVDPGHERGLGARVDIAHRILAAARHVDRHRGHSPRVERPGCRLPVFLPAVDSAPLQDDGWTLDALGNLQVAGERLVLEP